MNKQLADEFQTEYELANTPALPERLKNYHFLSFLCSDSEREIFLLENADHKRIICKHIRGARIALLRTEKEMDAYLSAHGNFSFFPYIIDYYETETDAYLLREYIDGNTLENIIEKDGPMTKEQARSILRKLCRCFQLLHNAEPPIIYRDLKPSNVVMTKSGECYLIDLGTTRVYQAGNEQDTLLVGTVATAAPEQYGARQTDARTDIYALGLLYSYLLTGELKKAEEPNPLLDKTDAKIIQKATSFDPDNRYQNIEEFLAAFDTDTTSAHAKKLCVIPITGLSLALACSLGMLLWTVVKQPKSQKEDLVLTNPTPDITVNSTPEISPDAILSITPTVTTPASTDEVIFESELMRRAVANALKKSENDNIYYGELNQITCLLLCGECIFEQYDNHQTDISHHAVNGSFHHYTDPSRGDIRDLSLLAYMTNLQELVLDYQQITDITPLAGLPLTRVSLCGNPITELAPLADCTALTELILDDTPVASLAPLESLHYLQTLSITRTNITEIAPVSKCLITMLSIGEISLTDYDKLALLPLRALSCKNLPHEALTPLSEIPTLSYLTLYASGITSFNELTMFSGLISLNLGFNSLENFNGIGSFPKLTTLYVAQNPLQSLAGIENATALLQLDITSSQITDFSALTSVSSLTELYIDKKEQESLLKAIPEPWFDVISWDN